MAEQCRHALALLVLQAAGPIHTKGFVLNLPWVLQTQHHITGRLNLGKGPFLVMRGHKR